MFRYVHWTTLKNAVLFYPKYLNIFLHLFDMILSNIFKPNLHLKYWHLLTTFTIYQYLHVALFVPGFPRLKIKIMLTNKSLIAKKNNNKTTLNVSSMRWLVTAPFWNSKVRINWIAKHTCSKNCSLSPHVWNKGWKKMELLKYASDLYVRNVNTDMYPYVTKIVVNPLKLSTCWRNT